ncbi:MAG: efflux RND transporter periplasmic adaptor subunit [Acidobacteriota bacterium]|nr:MAG: efflux RND transporter periplasmic adaptor subunit [Acidobacteriota bacterium]
MLLLAVLGYTTWSRVQGGSAGGLVVETARVGRVGGSRAQGAVAANGYIVARKKAALSTDIQGRLVELPVEEGDRVRAGQLVARLDTSQLEEALSRQRAELVGARAAAELAEIDLNRTRELVAGDAASQADLDAAEARLEQTRASVDALLASIREIEVQIEKSTVHAPFDGIVVQKNAEVGEVVSAIGAGGPDARNAVVTVVDFATLEVQVELAQTSLRAARVGAAVEIFLDAFPDEAYPGRVRQIWPTADRQKATVELRVAFLERDERILPEMGVRVVFLDEPSAEKTEAAVLLPQRALVSDPEPGVFVLVGDRVARRSIELSGEQRQGQLVVSDGLEGGELVVLDPPPALRDGDPVQRRQTAP